MHDFDHSHHDSTYAILLVDDDPGVVDTLLELFQDDYCVHTASCGAEAIAAVKAHHDLAAVVMDIRMAQMDGIEAARIIRTINTHIGIIFHTGYAGDYDEEKLDRTEPLVDFIQKGGNFQRLVRSVRNAVETYSLKQNVNALQEFAESQIGMIGQSPVMRNVFSLIRKVAESDTKVLIRGETGTGKELVARAIHRISARRDNRLAVFNCNHKSADLVESELFGHLKGAFTGAVASRTGLFEYADGGTIFLDEIGDLDITTQAKLLRVLETGEYQRIGAPEIRQTDVRLIAATHKPLEEMIDTGQFREDLYYRLKGIQVTLPPLRDRREDIPLLVKRFVDRLTIEQDMPPKLLDPQAIAILVSYEWPGNVRQLVDTIETMLVTTDSDVILAGDVTRLLNLKQARTSNDDEAPQGLIPKVEAFRRSLIEDALSRSNGNIAEAARLLQVDRANLSKWIRSRKISTE
jgi:DNA-binding NtrC family response regulator